VKVLIPLFLLFFGLLCIAGSFFIFYFVVSAVGAKFDPDLLVWTGILSPAFIGCALLAFGVYFSFKCFSEKSGNP